MMATRRSNHSTVPRRQWQGMVEPARAAVRRLGALAGLAQAHVLGDKDVLAHPRPRLVAAHLRAQPVAGGDAEAVSSTLSSAVKEATIHQKHPALWHACRVGDRRAVPIDEPAQRGRRAVTVLAHGPVRNWRRQRFQNVLGETDETDLRYYNERCQAQAIWSKGQTAWSC